MQQERQIDKLTASYPTLEFVRDGRERSGPRSPSVDAVAVSVLPVVAVTAAYVAVSGPTPAPRAPRAW